MTDLFSLSLQVLEGKRTPRALEGYVKEPANLGRPYYELAREYPRIRKRGHYPTMILGRVRKIEATPYGVLTLTYGKGEPFREEHVVTKRLKIEGKSDVAIEGSYDAGAETITFSPSVVGAGMEPMLWTCWAEDPSEKVTCTPISRKEIDMLERMMKPPVLP